MSEYKEFQEQIDRFKEHDSKAEELYNNFKDVFDIAIAKAKNSITMTGGLRDLSEAARSLSSIRGDAINATSHAFNSKMKVKEFELKKDRAEKGDDDLNTTSMIMRQLTEALQHNTVQSSGSVTNADFEDNSEELLKQRISNDLTTGSLKINVNERSMKYDFGGVTYQFDTNTESVVAIDKNGNKIENYPAERIPEEFRFKRFENGIPVDNCGREIKPYVG